MSDYLAVWCNDHHRLEPLDGPHCVAPDGGEWVVDKGSPIPVDTYVEDVDGQQEHQV